jgi:hypothetical protein
MLQSGSKLPNGRKEEEKQYVVNKWFSMGIKVGISL